MATGTITNPNSSAITQNLKSITRIAETATTGTTGNIGLGYSNDGYTFIVGAHTSGGTAYLRAWVSPTNNLWYLTAVNPNSGETINNTGLTIRYLVIKLYRSA